MGKFNLATLPDLNGKVALVTGGTNGLGELSVRNLALKGCRVYFTARSDEKARATVDKLQAHFAAAKRDAAASVTGTNGGITAKGDKLDLHPLSCDLSKLASVASAAEELKQHESRLDILMNNAAVCAVDYELTEDGLEIQEATNTVSHYYLTMLLLPLLVQTSHLPEYQPVEAASGSTPPPARRTVRIVNMSSLGHKMVSSKASWATLEDVNASFENEKFAALKRYGLSKLACLVITRELARLLKASPATAGVSAVCCDPGQSRTGLVAGPTAQYGALFKLYTVLSSPTWISAEQAVETQLFAAASPAVDTRALSGAYLKGPGKEQAMSPLAQDKDGHFGKDVMSFCKNFIKEKRGLDVDELLQSLAQGKVDSTAAGADAAPEQASAIAPEAAQPVAASA